MFNSEDTIEIYSFGTQRLLPAVLPASLRRRARVASVIRDDLSVFDDRKDSSIKVSIHQVSCLCDILSVFSGFR